MATTIAAPTRTITLRIRTAMVPPKVRDGVETVFGIQDKSRNLVPPVLDASGPATFEISVTPQFNAAGDLDVSGRFVHGKPGDRFLYLGWRPTAGSDDDWIRRWKIGLKNLPVKATAATCTIEANEAHNVWIGADWLPESDD
jgi:Family of unknown function (DUF5990)